MRGLAKLSLLFAAVAAACGGEAETGGSVASGTSATVGVGGGGGSSSTSSTTTTGPGSGGGGGSGGDGGSGGALTVAECYADDFVNPPMLGPDYDQFHPVVGSHCMGTNHQDITGVERVVFVGDSVTVGTPPTLSGDIYRSQLADALVAKFGLSAPDFTWKGVNWFEGTSWTQDSGDFSSCAKWGARTDDLLEGGAQIASCFPASELGKRTLVVMTMGGNDISALTQAHIDGAPPMELWMQTEDFVQRMRDALDWLYEPGRFPNGVFVIFANMYEFTDGTGEVESCDVSGLAGFDQPVPSPDELAAQVIWANEQYVATAVDHGADVVFLLEEFCGHGFHNDDPAAPCYRGPGTPRWFDLTCIHPNPDGHDHVTDMFMAVVNE
jgi:lysophospholipase L1-like esterase